MKGTKVFTSICVIIIICSCNSYKYITPQGEMSVWQRSYIDGEYIFRTVSENPEGVFSGPYIKLRASADSVKILMTGQEESIYIQDLSGKEFLRPVKVGIWYYYDAGGDNFDSIIHYKGVTGVVHRIDTVWSGGVALAIDSIISPVYKKEVIFRKP